MAEAFALAASAIGVAAFALQLWKDAPEIAKNGSSISTSDCVRQAAKLKTHCDRVKSLQDVEMDVGEAVSLPLENAMR